MSNMYKGMSPAQKVATILKDITGAQEKIVVDTANAVLQFSPILREFINTVEFSSGNTLHPYTDVVTLPTPDPLVINGISITKTASSPVILELTDETLEDINPAVGVTECLTSMISEIMGKTIEGDFITAVAAAALASAGAPTWEGIKAAIIDMGTNIYTTRGKVVVAVSLANYLEIIGTSGFSDAYEFIRDKLVLIPSEFISETGMLVFHTHGVFGGFDVRSLELDREGSSNSTAYVGSYNYGYAWDTKYIRYTA